jgi:nitrate reductase NapE
MPLVETQPGKLREAIIFVFLAVLIWPVLACVFVGAYGFAFWIYFMLAGPPGPR